MPDAGRTSVRARLELRSFGADLVLPPGTEVLRAGEPEALPDVRTAVLDALAVPTGTAPFAELCRRALAGSLGLSPGQDRGPEPGSARRPERASAGKAPSAVVVVSDNTRSVPYRGDTGILWPLVESLIVSGFAPEAITLLVAAGTHRRLSDTEMWPLLDDRVRRAGVRASCHDASDAGRLTFVGRTSAGDEVFMNRAYVEADFRVLTGLVEPHPMAGVSGGRKSICPGLVDVQSVRGFHGAKTLADPRTAVLALEDNPCHLVALEVAGMARPDFILNVTARPDGRVAGVFAGDMERAHAAAVAHLRSFVEIPLVREFDVVVTHGGKGGINYYQAQKAAEIAARAVRPGGYVVFVADTTEPDPVGTSSYRRLLRLLVDIGPEAFAQRIRSDGWEFVHDQWSVQTWGRVLGKVPREHVFYYSPQTPDDEYAALPNTDVGSLITALPSGTPGEKVARFVELAVERACRASREATGVEPAVAYLADGPHGIPVYRASGVPVGATSVAAHPGDRGRGMLESNDISAGLHEEGSGCHPST